MLVIDAGVPLALILKDKPEHVAYAEAVFAHAESHGVQLIAPRVITSEIVYQLLKQGRHRKWGEAKTAEYAELLDSMPLRLIVTTSPMASLVRYAWRHGAQGYDAHYVSVAAHFKSPLASLDGGQQAAAKSAGIKLWTH